MGILSYCYNVIFGIPNDDGIGGGLLWRIGWFMMTVSVFIYLIVRYTDGEMTYIYGINDYFWIALVGLILCMIPVAMNPEEEPKKVYRY